MSIVSVQGLTIRYGDLVAVDRIDLEVDSGEIVVLAGANGAGKTSTVEAIEGYRVPSSGEVRIAGLGPGAALDAGLAGVLLQDDGIYPGAKSIEVVDLFVRLCGGKGLDAPQLLALVGLEHRASTFVRRLSGGEHRRLGLALALVGEPVALLLDEPTAGLDAEGRDRVVDLLHQRRKAGAAALVTTHDFAFAEAIADRVVVMARGRLIAQGSPEELAPAQSDLTFGATASFDLERLAEHMAARVTEAGAGRFRVACPKSSTSIARLVEWFAAEGVEIDSVGDTVGGLEAAIRSLLAQAPGDEGPR